MDKDKELILLQCEKCGASFERDRREQEYASAQGRKPHTYTFYKYRIILCNDCFHDKMSNIFDTSMHKIISVLPDS